MQHHTNRNTTNIFYLAHSFQHLKWQLSCTFHISIYNNLNMKMHQGKYSTCTQPMWPISLGHWGRLGWQGAKLESWWFPMNSWWLINQMSILACVFYNIFIHITYFFRYTSYIHIYICIYTTILYIYVWCVYPSDLLYMRSCLKKKQVPFFQAFLFLPAIGSLTNSSRSFWLKQSAVARFWQGQKKIRFLASWVDFFPFFPAGSFKKECLYEMPQNIWRSKLVWFFLKMGEMTTSDSGGSTIVFLERQVPSLDSSKFGRAVGRWFWGPWCAFKRRISPTKWSFLQTMVIFNCIQHGEMFTWKKENVFLRCFFTDFGHYLLVITCEWSLEQTCSGCFGPNVKWLCFTWVT